MTLGTLILIAFVIALVGWSFYHVLFSPKLDPATLVSELASIIVFLVVVFLIAITVMGIAYVLIYSTPCVLAC